MKQLTYVGPFDAVDVQTDTDDLGNPVFTEVGKGATVDVADELAGRPPAPEFLDLHEAVVYLHHTEATPGLSDEDRGAAQKLLAGARTAIAVADRGEGLLGQPDNWELAPSAPPTTPTKAELKAAEAAQRDAFAALPADEQSALSTLTPDELAAAAALTDEERTALAALTDEERAALQGSDAR